MELRLDDRTVTAVEGIEKALTLLAAGDRVITDVRAHMAEHDHLFILRLLDLDVFGLKCSMNCPDQHYEWRPRL